MMRGSRRSSSLRLEFARRSSTCWKVEQAGVRVGWREGRKMTAGVPRLIHGSDAPAGAGACAGGGGLGIRQVQE